MDVLGPAIVGISFVHATGRIEGQYEEISMCSSAPEPWALSVVLPRCSR